MLNPDNKETSFLAFSDLLTGYRLSALMLEAHDAGLFAAVGLSGASGPDICHHLGWNAAYGERFLGGLVGLGLLRVEDGRYSLSGFAARYLHPQSAHYQGRTLAFERQLREAWQMLTPTLQAGQRVFSTGNKNPQALEQAFATYLGAMDEAARIRASELCALLRLPGERGTLLDIGSGSGAFLREFLAHAPGWNAIFCDLPQVVEKGQRREQLAPFAARIRWCACNLLDKTPSAFEEITGRGCDLVLLSNIVHCQGAKETALLLQKAASRTADRGLLVVHDFYSDCGWRGALYDIHMMLNTYNGRTYSLEEMRAMAMASGFHHALSHELPSGSTVLVLARQPDTLASALLRA